MQVDVVAVGLGERGPAVQRPPDRGQVLGAVEHVQPRVLAPLFKEFLRLGGEPAECLLRAVQVAGAFAGGAERVTPGQ